MGRQKISQWTSFGDAIAVFHYLRGVSTKKRRITLGTDTAESGIIHAPFIDVLG